MAEIISLAEYRRTHPASPPFVAPGEPVIVLVAACMWVAAFWTAAAVAVGRAL